MKAFLLIALLGFTTCHSVPTQIAKDVVSAPKLTDANSEKDSKISAFAEATELANISNPDGPAKTAVFESNSVVRKLAGPASEKDRLEAQLLVTKALSGKLDEALSAWAKARNDSDALNLKISGLEKKIETERQEAAVNLQKQLDEAQRKADAKRDLLIAGFTIGLGALAIAGAVAMLIFAPQNPIFGPKAALSLGVSGSVLIVTGMAVKAIERAMDNHPWYLATGVFSAIILIAISMALVYSNHHHATTNEAK